LILDAPDVWHRCGFAVTVAFDQIARIRHGRFEPPR
jgi:hypothetical protein